MVIVAAAFFIGRHHERMSKSLTWTGTYEVGDFVEYGVMYGNGLSGPTGDEVPIRYTITDISPTSYTFQEINYGNDVFNPISHTFPINSSFAFKSMVLGMPLDLSTYALVGNESIDTPWGSLLCQHLNYSGPPSNSKSANSYSEYWMFNGVMIKQSWGGYIYSQTWTLKNTNMEETLFSR
jgi:hypothetical protein